MKPKIILIVHNVRSAGNVGSILRTAEGLALENVYLSGYTPYPSKDKDSRLPHIAKKVDSGIAKTALGAEILQKWQTIEDIFKLLSKLQAEGWLIAGLEQNSSSLNLVDFRPPPKLALIVGNEISGIDEVIIKKCNATLQIPMLGKKESYNVAQATAMALYHCRFFGRRV